MDFSYFITFHVYNLTETPVSHVDIDIRSLIKQLPMQPILKPLSIRKEFYPSDVYVIREGELGSKFYIVSGGSVKVTKNKLGGEQELTVLEKNEYFGEKALYDSGDTYRQANVIAMPPGAECYTIDRS